MADTQDHQKYPYFELGERGELVLLADKPKQGFIPAAMLGIGGAPTRATTLPEAAADRKKFPVASGVLDYFPDALVAISHLSFKGNEQHNPGKPLHWARGKSNDHSDTMLRHFLQRGTLDTDGVRHSVKMAWRALALLQEEIEKERPHTYCVRCDSHHTTQPCPHANI